MRISKNFAVRRNIVQAIGAALIAPTISKAATKTDAIVIGQSCQLTGPFASNLAPVLEGQSLAFDEINRKGGIGGRQVKHVLLDDVFDTKRTISNTNQLINQDNASVLFGYTSSLGVAAVLPTLATLKVPLVNAYAGSPALRQMHHPNFFTSLASQKDEMFAVLKHLRTLGRTRIAVLYQNYMADLIPGVGAEAVQLGITLVSRVAIDSSEVEMITAVRTIAATDPQAVVVMTGGAALIPLVRLLKQNVAASIYCLSLSYSQQGIKTLGEDARGLVFAQPIPNPSIFNMKIAREFRAAAAAANMDATFARFYGFINTKVLIEAMKRTARTVTPASIVASLEGMSKVDLGGYIVDFSSVNHHGSKFVDLMVIGPGGKPIG